MINKIFNGVRHSAVASQPCPYRGHLTGGYVAHCVRPNLLSQTSHIPRTLYAMATILPKFFNKKNLGSQKLCDAINIQVKFSFAKI